MSVGLVNFVTGHPYSVHNKFSVILGGNIYKTDIYKELLPNCVRFYLIEQVILYVYNSYGVAPFKTPLLLIYIIYNNIGIFMPFNPTVNKAFLYRIVGH